LQVTCAFADVKISLTLGEQARGQIAYLKEGRAVKELRFVMMLAALLVSSGAIAQTATPDQSGTDTDIALLRSDVQAQKTDIIGKTMQLNDADAKVFWPLYREYSTKQQTLGDQRVSVIKDYAAEYDTLTDAQADGLMDRMVKFDKSSEDLELSIIRSSRRRSAPGRLQSSFRSTTD
jgi:hypothetical protein